MKNANGSGGWSLIGHDWAVDFLQRSLRNGRQRHAYLITGARSLGKRTLARAFAKALNCERELVAERPCNRCRACRAIERDADPDLIIARGEAGAPLKADAIRDVARSLALKPYAARYRIAIIEDFDLVAPLAQDSLLKTLEEPPPQAIIIVLANAEGKILRGGLEDVILPTIRSRAQIIPLRPAPRALIESALLNHGCDAEKAALIARLSGGRIGWALRAMADDAPLAFRAETLDLLDEIVAGSRVTRLKASERLSKQVGRDKARLRAILEIWQSFWRDVLLLRCDSPVKPSNSDRHSQIAALAGRVDRPGALAAVKATRTAMASLATNANIRLVLDALTLDYPGLD